MSRLGTVAKAIAGAAAAGLSAAVVFWPPTTTAGKVLVIALAVLGGLGVVYAVPNRKGPTS